MAFKIGNQVVINNQGEIENISKASIVGFATFKDDLYVAGVVTATFYEGDGSRLTNIAANAVDAGALDFSAVDINANSVTATAGLSGASLTVNGTTISSILDEDDMSSDSTSAVPTQQSVKAYVDDQIAALDLDPTDADFSSVDFSAQSLASTNDLTVGGNATIAGAGGVGIATFATTGIALNQDISAPNNTITAFAFVGDGSGLTNIAAGAVDESQLDFSGVDITANSFSGDGSGITNIDGANVSAANLDFAAVDLSAQSLSGDGSGITSIDGAEVSAANLDFATVDLSAQSLTATNGATVSNGGLLVTGDSTFTSTEVRVTGNLLVEGEVSANEAPVSSDRRLKTNIENIPGALEKVEQLNGVSFDWIKTGKSSAGIIAQEVQEVMPELVRDTGDHLTVVYNGLIGLLIEAVKELNEKMN